MECKLCKVKRQRSFKLHNLNQSDKHRHKFKGFDGLINQILLITSC